MSAIIERRSVRERVGTCSHLVAQPLRSNNGNFIADALIGFKVQGELRVVAFDDDFGGLFHCFRSNATHDAGVVRGMSFPGCAVEDVRVILDFFKLTADSLRCVGSALRGLGFRQRGY